MRLKSIELAGFKSFAKRTPLEFASAITSVVGPNGSGKSNIAESFRFCLGEQSMKSMRGRRGEDMIWSGSAAVPRAGRASVKLTFDNSDRALSLDFDEVSIERVVHRDGGNDYLLNGSPVRLRDISELLAQANIGASGHHIISQGEADRILTSSPRERREMIEDALGLTAFLYKREESEKKLEKTAENMREVEGLRRELAPHLKFLQHQVRKIEEAQKLRDELSGKYLEYLKRESVYLRITESLVRDEAEVPEREHNELNERITRLREELGKKRDDVGTSELMRLEAEGRSVGSRRDSISRELGRIEGELAAEKRIAHVVESVVSAAEARAFATRVERELEESSQLNEQETKNRLLALIVLTKEFLRRIAPREIPVENPAEKLLPRKEALERELAELETKERETSEAIATLRQKIDTDKDANREAERELFSAMARRSELETRLSQLRARREQIERERQQFKTEVGEAAALVGRAIADYESFAVVAETGEALSDADLADEDRTRQEERRRKLERMKIRLEEAGAGNSTEILKEHQETVERDAFLTHELADLTASAESLHALIADLTQTLSVRFDEGIAKISTEFDAFFKLMFGSGSASLELVKADEEAGTQAGVDLTVSLPHKRIKGLHMLSGGERALTSIALIFAMSQVNPPPFLILDETDAALDEANSRRYGDMIANLAQKSQLIVITHNRETMSRAGILYGITMGSDGVSKVLSVKFEEALGVAK